MQHHPLGGGEHAALGGIPPFPPTNPPPPPYEILCVCVTVCVTVCACMYVCLCVSVVTTNRYNNYAISMHTTKPVCLVNPLSTITN